MSSHQNDTFIDEIRKGLDTRIIGRKIIHFKEINSTNKFLKNLDKNKNDEGLVVVSDIQLSGRGRKDRKWSSPKGGLWFSILLYPNIPPNNGFIVTMASSIAIVKAIKDLTGLNSEIKWPNDILLKNKKVCGILTEIETSENNNNYFVVGIGINVNNVIKKNIQKTALSLKKIFGDQISRAELLRLILINLDLFYDNLNKGDHGNIRKLWLSNSKIINKKIKVQDGKNEIIGIVNDINENGNLILNTKQGIVKIFSGDTIYI